MGKGVRFSLCLFLSAACLTLVVAASALAQKPEKCRVKGKDPHAPRYRLARHERTVRGPDTLTIYISVDPRRFDRESMVALARRLKEDFCREPRITAFIFSDRRAAERLIFSTERLPNYESDISKLRGGYHLDRASGEEYVSFSPDPLKPREEVRINLGAGAGS